MKIERREGHRLEELEPGPRAEPEQCAGGRKPGGFRAWVLGGQGGTPRLSLVGGGIVGISAVLLALVTLWERPDTPRIRLKGGLSAAMFAQRGERQWKVTGEQWLQPGDEVRFVFNSPQPGYLYVVGMDAARKVNLYEPAGNKPRRVPRGQKQEVPGSIVLDETLGHERVLVLICPTPVTPGKVVAAATGALGRARGVATIVRLDLRCSQVALLLKKRAAGTR